MRRAEDQSGDVKFTVDEKGEIVPVGQRIMDTDPWGPGSDAAKQDAAKKQGQIGDYSNFLGIYNLPSDVQNRINQIFANTPDVGQATALAMAYVRGTPWYDQTYPGIKEGIAKGVVSNEAEYRSLLNQQTQLYKQYLGRDISAAEFGANLIGGLSTDRLNRQFAGAAYIGANRSDIQYTAGAFDSQGPFSNEELSALGNEQAGIDTELGQRVQRRLSQAQQRLQTIFNGSLATPSLSLSGGRLKATSLGADEAPDIAA